MEDVVQDDISTDEEAQVVDAEVDDVMRHGGVESTLCRDDEKCGVKSGCDVEQWKGSGMCGKKRPREAEEEAEDEHEHEDSPSLISHLHYGQLKSQSQSQSQGQNPNHQSQNQSHIGTAWETTDGERARLHAYLRRRSRSLISLDDSRLQESNG